MSSREQYDAAHQDEPVWPETSEQVEEMALRVRAMIRRDFDDLRELFEEKEAENARLRAALEQIAGRRCLRPSVCGVPGASLVLLCPKCVARAALEEKS